MTLRRQSKGQRIVIFGAVVLTLLSISLLLVLLYQDKRFDLLADTVTDNNQNQARIYYGLLRQNANSANPGFSVELQTASSRNPTLYLLQPTTAQQIILTGLVGRPIIVVGLSKPRKTAVRLRQRVVEITPSYVGPATPTVESYVPDTTRPISTGTKLIVKGRNLYKPRFTFTNGTYAFVKDGLNVQNHLGEWVSVVVKSDLPKLPAGNYRFTLTNNQGQGATAIGNFTINIADSSSPTLTALSPGEGSVGQSVTAFGANFGPNRNTITLTKRHSDGKDYRFQTTRVAVSRSWEAVRFEIPRKLINTTTADIVGLSEAVNSVSASGRRSGEYREILLKAGDTVLVRLTNPSGQTSNPLELRIR